MFNLTELWFIAIRRYQAYCAWLASMVVLYWYQALVERAEQLYFSGSVLYGANNLTRGRLDNMDQRIAADCRKFTQRSGAVRV